ncbi:MAG: DUF4834 family protein [Bacteroidota bacterium]
MGFLRIVFILILIYYFFRLFSRYILPIFIRNYIRKNQQDMFNRRHSQSSPNRQEGDINIDYVGKRSKKYNKDSGEYVDFEEVKD